MAKCFVKTIFLEDLDEETQIDGVKGLCDVNLEVNVASKIFLVQKVSKFKC